MTCKEWKQIASDNLTWKKLFEEKFKLPEPTEEPNDVNWEKRYLDAQKAFCEPKSLQFKEVGTVEIERAGYSYKEGPWLLTTSYSWLINETVCKVWNLESKESIIEILIDSWNKPIMDKGKLFWNK
ncbi:MAG: hypothetical protein HWD61_03610 [Parachlamydiaceae bacterium]|nr:MAG: hypothetical protein HWD61_03610 [Parachlamydiaceae bacterium]